MRLHFSSTDKLEINVLCERRKQKDRQKIWGEKQSKEQIEGFYSKFLKFLGGAEEDLVIQIQYQVKLKFPKAIL